MKKNTTQRLQVTEIKKLKEDFDRKGILIFPGFLDREEIEILQKEAQDLYTFAYKSSTAYNLFVEKDEEIESDFLRNTKFYTQKSCVCYDQIPSESLLKTLYLSGDFQGTICQILGIKNIYPYADSLSGINVNYYDPGDSLEWHYDNCNFTITILLQAPKKGGVYEYLPNMRYDQNGKENYSLTEKVLQGKQEIEKEYMEEGTLILFRGTESLHRVSKILEGQRILVTFCYNKEPGVLLSETSRKTFFGRIQ